MTETALTVLFIGEQDCAHSEQALDFLKTHAVDVLPVWSKGRGPTAPEALNDWQGDLLLSFRCHFKLPATLLRAAGMAAINFHPAPPKYPGSGSASWALYNEDGVFGVTAHLMTERIDDGPILEVREFPIDPDDNLPSLVERSKAASLALFKSVVSDVLSDRETAIAGMLARNASRQWQGPARRIAELDALQQISPDIDAQELTRIVRATTIGRFRPFIQLHGRRFILSDEPDA